MQYVVETRFEGERRIPGKATELLGTEAREVSSSALATVAASCLILPAMQLADYTDAVFSGHLGLT